MAGEVADVPNDGAPDHVSAHPALGFGPVDRFPKWPTNAIPRI